MAKKLNLKEIDFKDKKFVFPLVILGLVLFIAWFVFGLIKDFNSHDETQELDPEEVSEIQSIPIDEGKGIETKADAMNEAYRRDKDYTAMRGVSDPTLISADTTIYTEEEIAYLDSLERIANMSEAEIEAMNEQIKQQNRDLNANRDQIGVYDTPQVYGDRTVPEENQQDSQKALMDEMKLYQKLINGEEILTPEEEQARKEEQIRMEERQKVMAELYAQETLKVEKASGLNHSAFNTLSSDKSTALERNTIKAMVDQTIKVEQGSRVRFVLLEDVKLGNDLVRKGAYLYGTVTGFQDQRIITQITSILVNGKQLQVKLKALDVNGLEGLYVPKSTFRETAKTAASQAVQGGQMNITTPPDNFTGMAVQALQNAYQSVTSAVAGNIRKDKATIKYNTIVYLLNEDDK